MKLLCKLSHQWWSLCSWCQEENHGCHHVSTEKELHLSPSSLINLADSGQRGTEKQKDEKSTSSIKCEGSGELWVHVVISCEWEAAFWLVERAGGQAFCQQLIQGCWLLFIHQLQSFRSAAGQRGLCLAGWLLLLCLGGCSLVCLVFFFLLLFSEIREWGWKKEPNLQYIYQEKHYSCSIMFCDLRENVRGMIKVNVLTKTQISVKIWW